MVWDEDAYSSTQSLFDERLKSAEEVAAHDPNQAVELLFEASQLAVEAGHLNRAMAALLQLLTVRVEPAADLRLAELYLELGGEGSAVVHLERARRVYAQRGELAPLERTLRAIVRLDASRPEILEQLGRVSALQGNDALSGKCLRRAVQLYRNVGDERRLARLLARFPELAAPRPSPDLMTTTHRNIRPVANPSAAAPDDSATAIPPPGAPNDLARALASPSGDGSGKVLIPESFDDEDVDLDQVLAEFSRRYPQSD